ncbi:hypothetical protein [Kitasatospora sp. NPDC097643]|uniref:hypothetical protein n=1 Tax=Kitasatospora sp. NPDC097643 TaxID=3157230 RepID=UPI00332D95EE
MSNEDTTGAEAAALRGLSELAESIEAGAVPYDRVVAGGRRRLRRRRMLTTGAVALAVLAVVGGGTALGGLGRGAGAVSAAAGPTGTATPSSAATPSAATTPTATPSAAAASTASAAPSGTARDPFTPIRVKVREGTSNGHALEAWVALWPAAPTAEDGLKQGQLIWAERHAVDPNVSPDLPQGTDAAWNPHKDRVDVYLVADGKRQPGDYVGSTTGPGGTGKEGQETFINGVVLNRVSGQVGIPEMVVVRVGPEVAKVVVDWKAGGSTEAVPVAVGDSPVRWYAVVRKPGAMDNTATSYAADGSVLRTQTTWW